MDGLPEQSKIAYKFNGIQDPLMSIPVLCYIGCTVMFTKHTVQINKDRKKLLTGYREPATKLWRFPQDETIPPAVPQVTQQINAIIPEVTMSDTLNFLHKNMESPTNTMLLNVIKKNNLSTWPFSHKTTLPSFYQIQYPQRWGINIEHGRTLNLLNNQYSKPRKMGTSTSTHPSTIQRCPQGRYTPTKSDNFL